MGNGLIKMKKIIFVITCVISATAFAEFYKVEITRIDSNLYKTNEGLYIETQYCYEYATREEAILSYDQYSYDNKLIFKNGQSCEVKRVLR